MVRWKNKINMKDSWERAKKDSISMIEVRDDLVQKLKALPCFKTDAELQKIVDNFKGLTEEEPFDHFDEVLEDLYDWADQDNRLWIATF